MKAVKQIPSTPRWRCTPAPGEQLNSAAISGDGAVSVVGSSSEYDAGRFAVYAYGPTGALLWTDPISPDPIYQGVFWVAVSRDGAWAAAGGEVSKKGDDNGFLRAYRVRDGASLLSVSLPGRANQVSLSADGRSLLTAFTAPGDHGTLRLYRRSADDSEYLLADEFSLPGYGFNSCVLAAEGSRAVVSAISYGDDHTTRGKVLSFTVHDGALTADASYDAAVGSMRVAVVDDGSYWGASLHDGSCALFAQGRSQPVWTWRPAGLDLSLAYGCDITRTRGGRVVLAVGVNLRVHWGQERVDQPLGKLYVVESVSAGGAEQPKQILLQDLQYSPNPGVSLDGEAQYVTATDGKPAPRESGGSTPETPGNFYLFDLTAGALEWRYPTKIMNWPMVLSASGNAIIGGSDTGEALFWCEESLIFKRRVIA